MPRTLNPSVEGSSPSRPTSVIKGLGPLGTEYVPTGVQQGADTIQQLMDREFTRPLEIKCLEIIRRYYPVPTGANDPRQLDLFPEIRHPGL